MRLNSKGDIINQTAWHLPLVPCSQGSLHGLPPLPCSPKGCPETPQPMGGPPLYCKKARRAEPAHRTKIGGQRACARSPPCPPPRNAATQCPRTPLTARFHWTSYITLTSRPNQFCAAPKAVAVHSAASMPYMPRARARKLAGGAWRSGEACHCICAGSWRSTVTCTDKQGEGRAPHWLALSPWERMVAAVMVRQMHQNTSEPVRSRNWSVSYFHPRLRAQGTWIF
jgi:hypothetical protein